MGWPKDLSLKKGTILDRFIEMNYFTFQFKRQSYEIEQANSLVWSNRTGSEVWFVLGFRKGAVTFYQGVQTVLIARSNEQPLSALYTKPIGFSRCRICALVAADRLQAADRQSHLTSSQLRLLYWRVDSRVLIFDVHTLPLIYLRMTAWPRS